MSADHEDRLEVGVTIRPGLTGDAGEVLDAQAKREYKRRLHELNESLEDQRERGNHARADQIQAEVDILETELVRSIGRGGRIRRTGSNAERARLNVTRAIRAALEKISEQHAALGELLDRSIRTGSFCSYIPDREHAVVWQFSTDGAPVEREITGLEPIVSRRDSSFLRTFTSGTAFVGRDAERSILMRALDQSQRGEGRFVLIGGPAGVGKTRIAAEIANEALRRRMLTFVGGCYDRNEPVPFIRSSKSWKRRWRRPATWRSFAKCSEPTRPRSHGWCRSYAVHLPTFRRRLNCRPNRQGVSCSTRSLN